MTPQLWLLCGLAYSVGVVLLVLKVERQSKQIARLELDRQGIFRVLGNLVAGQQHWAAVELRELQRASQGFCTAHRTDGAPCTLQLGHDGMHSYAGEPFAQLVRSPKDVALLIRHAFEEDRIVLRLAELLKVGERASVRVSWRDDAAGTTLFSLAIRRADGSIETLESSGQERSATMNQFAVGAVGKKIAINNLAQRPQLTPKEALELAAWLVATAVPLLPGDPGAELGKFHKMLADAAEGTDLESAALEQLEE